MSGCSRAAQVNAHVGLARRHDAPTDVAAGVHAAAGQISYSAPELDLFRLHPISPSLVDRQQTVYACKSRTGRTSTLP